MSAPGSGAAWAILMHGMAQTSWSMALLARDLRRDGHRVRNLGYPTRPYDVAQLSERYLAPAIDACGGGLPVHLVTHSLGGIIARQYLQRSRLPAGSRVVMLAPPNHGSEVADFVRHWRVYRWWMGQVGQQLGTGPDGIVHHLRPVDAQIGIIAGNRTLQPWFSRLIPGDDDGAVSVASTRLDEMRDFVVVSASHTLIMFNRQARSQVRHFLREGAFHHG
ncbi:MAG: alpha/beta fold hydrolase [Chromatiaceae bacterium]|nr:alpha/beta fold hydrolase [Gammaproteobacteria bacterium]MCP5300354.1 alpha/beta fold hydrolase [Chromatiaceae bacterium]MCP5422426.1 alpha/beta fold hydrolase [Chromatiaceae bacterium]